MESGLLGNPLSNVEKTPEKSEVIGLEKYTISITSVESVAALALRMSSRHRPTLGVKASMHFRLPRQSKADVIHVMFAVLSNQKKTCLIKLDVYECLAWQMVNKIDIDRRANVAMALAGSSCLRSIIVNYNSDSHR